MSKIALSGNASGTGTFTVAAPNTNSNYTLTLPEETGTVLTSGGAIDVDASAPADSVVIDSSGNVGIGTSSPGAKLEVNASNFALSNSYNTLSSNFAVRTTTSAGANVGGEIALGGYNDGTSSKSDFVRLHGKKTNGINGNVSGYFAIEIADDGGPAPYMFERMRIDSSGNLLVGTTTGYAHFASKASSGQAAGWFSVATNGDAAIFIANASNGTVGSIIANASTTSYNTSSDYRLKEDWQAMSGSIDRLKNLNPVNFAWKADGSRVDGFLAHEAAEVVPEAVTGEKDAVEALGNVTDAEGTVVQENVKEPAELSEGQTWTKTEDRPVYQGIDQAKLVPLLTAALQEAIAKIETLEAKVAALEATP